MARHIRYIRDRRLQFVHIFDLSAEHRLVDRFAE